MEQVDIRRAAERGQVDLGWLKSAHTLSFADYYDPKHMGFGALRVINDDVISPAMGFGTHPHKNMEIITYVLSGVLEHKDSMGNTSQIRAGDVQRMSAGTGVEHSEFNASQTDPVHLLQIWVLPESRGLTPSYEQIHFSPEDKKGILKLIGSQNGRDSSIKIAQDISVFASILNKNDPLTHVVPTGRIAWVHVASGEIKINGEILSAGDALSLSGEDIHLTDSRDAEVLVFDMAA